MKKLNMIITVVMLAMLTVFAGGCGNGDVALVKNGTLDNNSGLTVGKALDNYSYFATKEWKALETENGRKFVEFRATYDVEPLFKNTDIKQFYLVIQFLINADNKSFDLSYIGKEVVQKDGKVKNKKLYFADNIFNDICQNKDTMAYAAPAVIKAKAQRFNDKAVGEILDNYKSFTSIKWKGSEPYFSGILKLDNNAKKSGIKQQQLKYDGLNRFELVKEYSDGQKESVSLSDRYEKKALAELITELINNQKISLFNNSPDLCRGTFKGKSYLGNNDNIHKLVVAEVSDRLRKGKIKSNSPAKKYIVSSGQPITKIKVSLTYSSVDKVDEYNKKSYNSARINLWAKGSSVYMDPFLITYTVQVNNKGQLKVKLTSDL